uniref:Uncharacterized protein n=1 Tax=viral metagenome TaxID=1070528 RepID=A0A6C0KRL5_9ZZZZ
MEVQNCAYTSPNVYNSDSNYGKINITSVIMCFLIIYSTALSIVLSVKQLIQIIKEEELLNEEEKKEEKEEEEEEVIKEEEKETKEEDYETDETYEHEEEDEEEILLANYHAKERALALQEIYKERLQALIEKRASIIMNLANFSGFGKKFVLKNGDLRPAALFYRQLTKYQECTRLASEELVTYYKPNDVLLTIIEENIYKSMINDLELVDKEIVICAKKVGMFEANSDLVKDLPNYIEPEQRYYDTIYKTIITFDSSLM